MENQSNSDQEPKKGNKKTIIITIVIVFAILLLFQAIGYFLSQPINKPNDKETNVVEYCNKKYGETNWDFVTSSFNNQLYTCCKANQKWINENNKEIPLTGIEKSETGGNGYWFADCYIK